MINENKLKKDKNKYEYIFYSNENNKPNEEKTAMSYAIFYSNIDNREYTMNPVWKVVTTNKNDGKDTKFFVDLETGEITELIFE